MGSFRPVLQTQTNPPLYPNTVVVRIRQWEAGTQQRQQYIRTSTLNAKVLMGGRKKVLNSMVARLFIRIPIEA